MAKKPFNWWLWAKMLAVGGGICYGGPALVRYVQPTEEELFQKYNPELQKRSLENRAQREQEFDDFVNRLKKYSKSDKPIWTVQAEAEKEEAKQASIAASLNGKGTPRRKVKRAPARSAGDDKKLQQSLKKLNVQPIQAIEEVNMFKSDGNVIHFAAPKVHAAVPANTFAIYGNGEDKELTELVPGILNQLGPDSLASLRKLAESYQNMQKNEKPEEADDDEIPELVAGETFENKVE
ncbi:nascent polypeptide-associated complex subunit beta [Dichotomopilus funicola]|uniref:Nascent polypeptide-associated complex subunit beta n=1 Tax=Dichotomopilus funicola TaxID=1934379 RepID=A0AAN6UWG7_9PEZI|nr:nascent polypeptide-associated complex subunit beta [Dichotomopilus funicola]